MNRTRPILTGGEQAHAACAAKGGVLLPKKDGGPEHIGDCAVERT